MTVVDWSNICTRLSWLNKKNGQQNQKIWSTNLAPKDDICFIQTRALYIFVHHKTKCFTIVISISNISTITGLASFTRTSRFTRLTRLSGFTSCIRLTGLTTYVHLLLKVHLFHMFVHHKTKFCTIVTISNITTVTGLTSFTKPVVLLGSLVYLDSVTMLNQVASLSGFTIFSVFLVFPRLLGSLSSHNSYNMSERNHVLIRPCFT